MKVVILAGGLGTRLSVELRHGKIETEGGAGEDWIVHLKNTGIDTNTADALSALNPG